MNIGDIQDNFRIGTEVSVLQRTGRQVEGTLIGISESSITIRLRDGRKKVVSADAIDDIDEILPGETIVPSSEPNSSASVSSVSSPPIVVQKPVAQTTPSPSPEVTVQPTQANIKNSEANTAYSIEVLTKVAEINASFKALTEQAKLEPIKVDLSLPKVVKSLSYNRKQQVENEWNKLKQKYENAKKLKDLSRLNNLIREYENVASKYPEIESIARFNLGCLYLEVNLLADAVKAFELEAANSQKPEAFYNLAVASLRKKDKDVAKACYGLQEYFKSASLENNLPAWHKFIGLALDLGVVNVLTELLESRLKQQKQKEAELILESAVFLLVANHHEENARTLTSLLLQDSNDLQQAPGLLKSMLSQLSLNPDREYLSQQQTLKEAQRIAKEKQEKAKGREEVERLLNSARKWAYENKYSQAIAEVRKALQIDPENTWAQQLEVEYREADKEKGLPKQPGPYRDAKEAEIIEHDFRKAEKLYRQAIKKNDRRESAVNDLAALLLRLNRDEEAIKLLREYRSKVINKKSIINMLASAYQRMGQYQNEIDCLKQIINLPENKRRQSPDVLKRIAVAQFKLEEYQKSEDTLERVLQISPSDEWAISRINSLREARETGIYTELDALFVAQEGIANAGTTLSDLLSFRLEQCNYEGLEASKQASKEFTEKDVETLKKRAETIGTKRPGERASYFLSAAKILMDLGEKPEEIRPRVYLRNFCAAMGDACIAEQKHYDVARSYYEEAFTVAPDWVPQLEVKLSQYVMLYNSRPEELLQREIPPIDACLEKHLTVPQISSSIVERLLYLSWLNKDVSRFLIKTVNPNKRLRESIQNLCYQILGEQGEATKDETTFFKLWERGQNLVRHQNQEIVDELGFLNSGASGLDSLPDQIERVEKLRLKTKLKLDTQRLIEIKEILNYMYEYSQQHSYAEREYYATIVQNRIADFIEDIEKNPTKHSWELFRIYLLSLEDTIKNHFDEIRQAAEPEELKTELSIKNLPNTTNVECQITISNELGKSPASSIKVNVLKSPEDEYQVVQSLISVKETLSGGESFTCQIPVKINEIAQQSQVFTLYYRLSYTTRTKKEPIESEHAEAISLYDVNDFKEINNPYAHYAKGSTVENEKMFFGRDQLISYMVKSIQSSLSTRSLVIYGQKRAGKSSVLYHLKKRLELPFIPIRFSIGDMVGSCSISSFLYRIIQRIESTFDDLAESGYYSIEIQRPTFGDLEKNPLLRFQDYMQDLRKAIKKSNQYKNARIMLLIDEFSYLYGEINDGRVQGTFMKFWKALLEQGYFGAVLVGQDSMPKFIKKYPNEFQVAESHRLSYLADEDARSLIEKPILIPETGESRYKGDAVKRLIQLTAGNPYYIQIFCNQLVIYMNQKKAIYVTDADIEQVKNELISGHNRLDAYDFDNLTSSSDSLSDEIYKSDTEVVLRSIANGTRIQDYCERAAINADTSVDVDIILDDLEKREVIEKKPGASASLFRIRVGLFKEWLLAH